MKDNDIDPVEELHLIRRKLYKDAGGTPEAFVRYIMRQQRQYADRLVNLGQSKPAPGGSARKPAKPATKDSARKPRSRRGIATA